VNLDLSKKTVLIVDDDRVSAFLFIELLEPTGAKIISANSGQSALQAIRKQLIDLVLLDLKLNDCTGYTLLKEIRQLNPHIKIIAQTAYAMIEDYRECMEAGFDDYLPKPIVSEDLYAKLMKYLASENSVK
jgi:CheY-like chemotaxis protein